MMNEFHIISKGHLSQLKQCEKSLNRGWSVEDGGKSVGGADGTKAASEVMISTSFQSAHRPVFRCLLAVYWEMPLLCHFLRRTVTFIGSHWGYLQAARWQWNMSLPWLQKHGLAWLFFPGSSGDKWHLRPQEGTENWDKLLLNLNSINEQNFAPIHNVRLQHGFVLYAKVSHCVIPPVMHAVSDG